MQKRTIIAILVLGGALLCACGSKATDEQITQMCRHLLELEGKVNFKPLEERIAEIEEEYKAKEDLLNSQKERDLKGYTDAQVVQLDEIEKTPLDTDSETDTLQDMTPAEKESTRARVNELTEQNIKLITDQWEKDVKKLKPQRESALRAARVRSKEDAEKAEKLMKACVDEAKKQEISTELAQCRINAPNAYRYKNDCQ